MKTSRPDERARKRRVEHVRLTGRHADDERAAVLHSRPGRGGRGDRKREEKRERAEKRDSGSECRSSQTCSFREVTGFRGTRLLDSKGWIQVSSQMDPRCCYRRPACRDTAHGGGRRAARARRQARRDDPGARAERRARVGGRACGKRPSPRSSASAGHRYGKPCGSSRPSGLVEPPAEPRRARPRPSRRARSAMPMRCARSSKGLAAELAAAAESSA